MFDKIFYYIGKLLEKKKKWEWAITYYLKAQDDTNAISNYRLAFCYEKRKDYGNAIYYYKKALALEEKKAHWYFRIANAYMGIKKEKLAAKYLKNAINIDPKNKKYQKRYQKIRSYFQDGIPEIDIFITSIEESQKNIFLFTVTGYLSSEKDLMQLEVSVRKHPLDRDNHLFKLNPTKITVDKKNIFKATFEISKASLSLSSHNIVSYIWDFFLVTNRKTRIKYFENKNLLFSNTSFDFIPYRTSHDTFSLLTTRKSLHPQTKNKLKYSLILPRVDTNTMTTQYIINIANMLASMECDVTLIALDMVAISNKLPISYKVNIEYVSLSLHRKIKESFNFNSSKTILPDDYISQFKTYFSHLKTDVLYSPVFGAPFLNIILSSTSDDIFKIIGEYSDKRYKIYDTLMNKKTETTLTELIKKTKDNHLFENINTINMLHLIKPEVQPLFNHIPNIKTLGHTINDKKALKSFVHVLKDLKYEQKN